MKCLPAEQSFTCMSGKLDLTANNSELAASTSDDVEVSGEAVINNRKKKMIAIYELDLSGKWSGMQSPPFYLKYKRPSHCPNCLCSVGKLVLSAGIVYSERSITRT